MIKKKKKSQTYFWKKHCHVMSYFLWVHVMLCAYACCVHIRSHICFYNVSKRWNLIKKNWIGHFALLYEHRPRLLCFKRLIGYIAIDSCRGGTSSTSAGAENKHRQSQNMTITVHSFCCQINKAQQNENERMEPKVAINKTRKQDSSLNGNNEPTSWLVDTRGQADENRCSSTDIENGRMCKSWCSSLM